MNSTDTNLSPLRDPIRDEYATQHNRCCPPLNRRAVNEWRSRAPLESGRTARVVWFCAEIASNPRAAFAALCGCQRHRRLSFASRATSNKPENPAMDLNARAFFLLKFENAEEGDDRSINRDKEIVHEEEQYDVPKVIVRRLKKFETEITAGLEEREEML